MNPFAYHRAKDADGAVAAISDQAKFLAGGTNLVDLMKNGVEKPDKLIDINRLTLSRIESLPNGGSRVSMAATMQGPLTAVFTRMFGRIMAGYYPTAVRQLVATAEGRTFTPATHS